MNGKAAKMLRKFRRSDHKSKRLFKSLTHVQKGIIRKAHEENVKFLDIDYLGHFYPTGNEKIEYTPSKPKKMDMSAEWTIKKGEDIPVQIGDDLVNKLTQAITENIEETKNA